MFQVILQCVLFLFLKALLKCISLLQPYHPCDTINSFMLELLSVTSGSAGSGPSFAISHDDDWRFVWDEVYTYNSSHSMEADMNVVHREIQSYFLNKNLYEGYAPSPNSLWTMVR